MLLKRCRVVDGVTIYYITSHGEKRPTLSYTIDGERSSVSFRRPLASDEWPGAGG